jgi:hypothetical protein
VWWVGVRLDVEIKRGQVSERAKEVMASEKMRASAARGKGAAEATAYPGGSWYESLLSMVKPTQL